MNISEFFRITPDNIVQCVNYIVTLKTLKSVKYLDEGYDDPDNFDLTFEYFLNEEESDSYKTDYVDKHKLLSIQNVEKRLMRHLCHKHRMNLILIWTTECLRWN